jgi:TldD protein
MALRLHDSNTTTIQTSAGRLIRSKQQQSFTLSSELRIGSPSLDNTRPLQENFDPQTTYLPTNKIIDPLNTKEVSLKAKRQIEWLYRKSRKKWHELQTNLALHPRSENQGWDHHKSQKIYKHTTSAKTIQIDSTQLKIWERDLKDLSMSLKDSLWIYESEFNFVSISTKSYLSDTDSNNVEKVESLCYLDIVFRTRGKHGEILQQFKKITFTKPPKRLNTKDLQKTKTDLLLKLVQNKKAPNIKPFAGPVILKGKAAAVYIHEVIGHRLEAHRFKIEEDGRTFYQKVGEKIAPNWIDIIDDATQTHFHTTPLNGHYTYDDQGVKSKKVELIKDGILKTFLIGKASPNDTLFSNGHSRGNLNKLPSSRMANTQLIAQKTMDSTTLMKTFKNLIKKSDKNIGYIIYDLSGGFTFTDQTMPQTFKLTPFYLTEYNIKTGKETVVKNADISGTPLVSLNQIIAAGENSSVFNGYCGAESGWVPVSSISPDLLFKNMELETQYHEKHLPPLLDMPK